MHGESNRRNARLTQISREMTCEEAIGSHSGTLRRFDTDNSGTISNTEALQAVNAYNRGEITEEQASAVASAADNNCSFNPDPPEAPGAAEGLSETQREFAIGMMGALPIIGTFLD